MLIYKLVRKDGSEFVSDGGFDMLGDSPLTHTMSSFDSTGTETKYIRDFEKSSGVVIFIEEISK